MCSITALRPRRASSEFGETERASGIFVIVSLTATNKLDSPATIDDGAEQFHLLTDDRQYSQNFDVANGGIDDSCLFKDPQEVQPGLQRRARSSSTYLRRLLARCLGDATSSHRDFRCSGWQQWRRCREAGDHPHAQTSVGGEGGWIMVLSVVVVVFAVNVVAE